MRNSSGRSLWPFGAWLKPSKRLRHWFVAVIAGVFLAGIAQVFEPVDWGMWLIQNHLWREPASGSIVFAGADGALAVPESAPARLRLASALDALGRSGAGHIYLDLRLDRPSDAKADAELAAAIARLGSRITLVERAAPGRASESTEVMPVVSTITPRIAGQANTVAAIHPEWPFGFAWTGYRAINRSGGVWPSLATALAGVHAEHTGEFPVDYAKFLDSIPRIDINALVDGDGSLGAVPAVVHGRSVVIGRADVQSAGYDISPGHDVAPQAYADIFAAETLIDGHDHAIGWPLPLALAAVLTLLAGVAAGTAPVLRRCLYGAALLAPAAVFLAGAHAHMQTTQSPSLVFLAAYALCRWLANRRAKLALVDPLTGMPTLHALSATLADRRRCAGTALVLARIVNYDDVLSSLPDHLHVQYALAITERLRAADPHLKIYKASTGLYGWATEQQAPAVIEDHLKGLRAIFAQPLMIDGRPIDTAITFGVDTTTEGNAATKLAAASAAAFKATEAHQPVRQAIEQEPANRMWEVSMHAALDTAMERGEFYTVYQPQFSLKTGALVGAEALARWRDPVRGEISPAYFIEQCEHAGRMEALTRFVLGEALAARNALVQAHGSVDMSVNISATLLGDDTMPRLLREALALGYSASGLTLEITETARIAEMGRAEQMVSELQRMGARISIDDFGVESGNFLNLLRLPCDELKIDRAFVAGLRDNARAPHIIAALAHFGHIASVSTVAEGIEDGETLALLRELGCDAGQGYFLARPMKLDVLLRFLAETKGSYRLAAA